MPDDVLRKKVLDETVRNLKKLMVAKGALMGNFYFAGDARQTDAVLYVTLSSKDPTGQKARSRGKAIRKDVARARFAMGRVRVDGRKLVFLCGGGNAPPSLIKKSLRGSLAEQKGLGFLKKASVAADQGEVEADPEEDVGEISLEDLGLSDRQAEAMKNRMRTDPALAALFSDETRQAKLARENETLTETFLSEEALAEEREEARAELLVEIDTLSGALREAVGTDGEAAALAAFEEACTALASLSATGAPPFTGDQVDKSLAPMVGLTVGINIEALARQHAEASAKLRGLEQEMLALDESEQSAFALEQRATVQQLQGVIRDTLKQMQRLV